MHPLGTVVPGMGFVITMVPSGLFMRMYIVSIVRPRFISRDIAFLTFFPLSSQAPLLAHFHYRIIDCKASQIVYSEEITMDDKLGKPIGGGNRLFVKK